MPRLLFEKRGNAVWISHLDLMRLFQRAFKRAGLQLTHTQGFNPRPSVAIAMPLSVGIESCCELLDFDLDVPEANDRICELLNQCLVDGIRVLNVYDNGSKIKNLAFLDCTLTLEYDGPVPEDSVSKLIELFSRENIEVEKKSKSGIVIQNIKPMIQQIRCDRPDPCSISIEARICCQNPSLNPMLINQAVCVYLPELQPAYTKYARKEILDINGSIFR